MRSGGARTVRIEVVSAPPTVFRADAVTPFLKAAKLTRPPNAQF